MFGKPEWFEKKSVGWGLRPLNWRGWLYAMSWVAVLCVPFIALLAIGKVFEAIWLVIMMFGMLLDVQHVRRELTAGNSHVSEAEQPVEEDDVMIIDEDSEPAHFATRSYDLHFRR